MTETSAPVRRPLTRENALFGIVGILFGFAIGFLVAYQLFGHARPSGGDRRAGGMAGGAETQPADAAPFVRPDGTIDMDRVPPELKARMEEAHRTVEEARSVLEKDPANAEALQRIAGVYLMLGVRGQMGPLLDKALGATDPKDRPKNVVLGDISFDMMENEKSVVFYDRALALRKDDPDVLTDSAIVLMRLQRLEESEERLRLAMSLDRKHWQSRYYAALLLFFQHGDPEGAEKLLAEVDALRPGFEGTKELREEMARGPHGAGTGPGMAPPLAPGAEQQGLPPGHPPVEGTEEGK